MRGSPRLVDIAEHAGVSEATVSRVLNDKPNVAEATRQAVLTALDVLGYERPYQLRRRSAGLVGLIVPELDNPIFPALAQVVETALMGHDYTTLLCTQTAGGMHEDDYTQTLLDRGVAGIVFVNGQHADTTTGPERYLRLREAGLPLVMVNGYYPGIDAPFLSTDDVTAVRLAVRHLSQLGHTRIGLAVGPDRYVSVQRKVAGFVEAVAEMLPVESPQTLVERTSFTVEGGAAAATRLLGKGCTGIVCGSDLMALGAIRAARALGRGVPDEISVVGYDDSPLMAFTDPPLTTVRQPVVALGEAAVRALLDEVERRPAPREEMLFLPELVVRSSTGPGPR